MIPIPTVKAMRIGRILVVVAEEMRKTGLFEERTPRMKAPGSNNAGISLGYEKSAKIQRKVSMAWK